jgi:hypothetical protein
MKAISSKSGRVISGKMAEILIRRGVAKPIDEEDKKPEQSEKPKRVISEKSLSNLKPKKKKEA